MVRLLWAGMMAAIIQAATISLLTAAMYWRLGGRAITISAASESMGGHAGNAPTNISWVYLLIAILVSLLRTPSVRSTASYLKLGFRSVRPADPVWAAITLRVTLFITAIGCGILAVEEPPTAFLKLGLWLGNIAYGHTAWADIMSVAAAGFGANTHATLLARG